MNNVGFTFPAGVFSAPVPFPIDPIDLLIDIGWFLGEPFGIFDSLRFLFLVR